MEWSSFLVERFFAGVEDLALIMPRRAVPVLKTIANNPFGLSPREQLTSIFTKLTFRC